MQKLCTGPRYAGETQTLAATDGWHGCYGHINVLNLDQESSCTGYGEHNRVVAFCPEGNTMYARIDRVWNLNDPTDAQIIKTCRAQNVIDDMRGKWRVVERDEWDDGSAVDIKLERR